MIRSTLFSNIKSQVPNEIREVHLYRGRLATQENEEAFPHRPCLLIEFGDVTWDETQQRTKVSEPFNVTVHLLQDCIKSDDDEMLARYDFLEFVAAHLHGMGVDGDNLYKTTPFIHSRDILDPEPSRIYHDQLVFTTTMKAQAALWLHRGVKTQPKVNESGSYS